MASTRTAAPASGSIVRCPALDPVRKTVVHVTTTYSPSNYRDDGTVPDGPALAQTPIRCGHVRSTEDSLSRGRYNRVWENFSSARPVERGSSGNVQPTVPPARTAATDTSHGSDAVELNAGQLWRDGDTSTRRTRPSHRPRTVRPECVVGHLRTGLLSFPCPVVLCGAARTTPEGVGELYDVIAGGVCPRMDALWPENGDKQASSFKD